MVRVNGFDVGANGGCPCRDNGIRAGRGRSSATATAGLICEFPSLFMVEASVIAWRRSLVQ